MPRQPPAGWMGAALRAQIDQVLPVVTAVGDDGRGGLVGCLPGRESARDRQTSSHRRRHGSCWSALHENGRWRDPRPFLPPAAKRGARTMEESINCISAIENDGYSATPGKRPSEPETEQARLLAMQQSRPEAQPILLHPNLPGTGGERTSIELLGGLAAWRLGAHSSDLRVWRTAKSPGNRMIPGAYCRWLRGLDLNQRPSGYEPDELPGCSTPRQRVPRPLPSAAASLPDI